MVSARAQRVVGNQGFLRSECTLLWAPKGRGVCVCSLGPMRRMGGGPGLVAERGVALATLRVSFCQY